MHAGSHPLNVVVADTPVSQVRAFLDQRKDRDDDNNNCAWVEGLADALGALSGARQGDSVLGGQARAWVATQMRKVALLQVQPTQQDIVFSHARIVAPRMQQHAGCFRAGLQAASTQVDFTAHCLSAMVKLQRNSGIFPRH